MKVLGFFYYLGAARKAIVDLIASGINAGQYFHDHGFALGIIGQAFAGGCHAGRQVFTIGLLLMIQGFVGMKVFAVSADNLLNDNENSVVELQNHELNEQLMLLNQLDDDEKNALIKIINSMLTKKRMKDLLDGKVNF